MKKRILFFAIILLFNYGIRAQVTIGSNTPPASGAILQLKENDSINANSTKGLLLPRLQLNGHNLDSIETEPSDTPGIYVGLTIWNLRGIGDICKGVNTWTGTEWVSAMPKAKDHTNYNTATGILTDHEGNTYTTSQFDTAGRWMTVNLRTRRAPGSCADIFFLSEITNEQWSNDIWMQVAMFPNSEGGLTAPSTWSAEEGMLYTWSLATNGKGGADGRGNEDNPGGANINENTNQAVERQGICPDGWHLPSNKEWKDLLAILQKDAIDGTDYYGNYTQPNAGPRGGYTTAKANATIAGTVPNGASKPAANGGFDALLVGNGAAGGSAYTYGTRAMFWTASSSATDILAYNINFSPSSSTFNPSTSSSGQKNWFFAVRCKQN
ncbi:MAG: FISUMP domain-containing protein [Dysgonomonas sp.]